MMNLRARTLWYSALAAVALVSAVSSTLFHWPNETVLQAQEPPVSPEGGKLPPLVIDTDEPLLLDEPKDLVRPDKPFTALGVGDTVDVRRFACEPRPGTDTDTGTVLQRGSGGRKVAVKIIDSAMDVHAVVEWFEAERRTLAFADSRR